MAIPAQQLYQIALQAYFLIFWRVNQLTIIVIYLLVYLKWHQLNHNKNKNECFIIYILYLCSGLGK